VTTLSRATRPSTCTSGPARRHAQRAQDLDRQIGGAKFWLKVFNELRSRGVNDILIALSMD
jgi:hypothetical protein